MISLTALAVFSGLSLNLLLTFAIGSSGIVSGLNRERKLPYVQIIVLFFSVIMLWIVLNYIFTFLSGGFLVFFLLFPFSALSCYSLELLIEVLIKRFAVKNPLIASLGKTKIYHSFTAYDGLVPVSLFITMNLAWNLSSAIILSLFFALGNLLAILILDEISRRAGVEKVPRALRGSPLILISMGLLSFVFASLAGIFLIIF